MSMKHILRAKRKELGMTQEQVANSLGVSTPAVNKWEKGATYPDFTLLPALARLLKTDLNTLLCFHEEMSSKEIGLFLNQVGEAFYKVGFTFAFAMAMKKVQEYPASAQLVHSLAMMMEGSLMMSELSLKQKEQYEPQIIALYERVAKCADAQYADQANYRLAAKMIVEGEYQRAQEKLDALPEHSALDKRSLQANLWIKEGKAEEAAKLLEHKLLANLQETQSTLAGLAKIAIKEGDEEDALRLADCGQKEVEIFGMWKYGSYIIPLEVAVLRKDVAQSLLNLKAILQAALTPWDMEKSPICKHIQQKEAGASLGSRMLPSLLRELENSVEYEFLQGEPEFQQLLAQYRAI